LKIVVIGKFDLFNKQFSKLNHIDSDYLLTLLLGKEVNMMYDSWQLIWKRQLEGQKVLNLDKGYTSLVLRRTMKNKGT